MVFQARIQTKVREGGLPGETQLRRSVKISGGGGYPPQTPPPPSTPLDETLTLCLNVTLSCVDFMDVIMGDISYITTLCLNRTLSCVDFMDVIMGDIPYITTLCLNGTLPCVDFMDVIRGRAWD